MKRLIILLLSLISSQELAAQARSGIIADYYSREGLINIYVANRKKNKHSFSDKQGKFTIDATVLDTILFSGTGFHLFKITIHPYLPLNLDTIFLKRNTHNLKEVSILSGYPKLKSDSIEIYKLYHKRIADAQRKSKTFFIPPFFIYSDGGISELASRISGQKKRDKKFLAMIKNDYEERYIALYYNTAKVKELLKMDDSTAMMFIAKHPMPFDYAKETSALEKDIWIREQYKQFAGNCK